MSQRARPQSRQGGRSGRAAARPAGPRMRGGDLAAVREQLQPVIEPVVAGEGYDLEDLTVKAVGRRHLVRVVIDGDGGVSLDVIADVSRAISAALDAAEEDGSDPIPGEYQLEVSSPGVDRPLTLPRHWRRNIGRLVKVRTGGTTGGKMITGRIVDAGDAEVTLEVAGMTDTFAHGDLGPGQVQVEFRKAADDAEAAEDAAELDNTEDTGEFWHDDEEER